MEPRPDKKTAKKYAAPYARKAFQDARAKDEVTNWEFMLGQLSEVMQDPELKDLPHTPRLGKDKIGNVMKEIMDILGTTEAQRKLVNKLIEDGKLSLLPYVHEGFIAERKKAEGFLEVVISTAIELTPQELKNLKETLRTRFNFKAEPTLEVDPELIGGVKLTIGDKVYDQTVKGQLERLRKHLDGPQ